MPRLADALAGKRRLRIGARHRQQQVRRGHRRWAQEWARRRRPERRHAVWRELGRRNGLSRGHESRDASLQSLHQNVGLYEQAR
jgi:hypothetical protein